MPRPGDAPSVSTILNRNPECFGQGHPFHVIEHGFGSRPEHASRKQQHLPQRFPLKPGQQIAAGQQSGDIHMPARKTGSRREKPVSRARRRTHPQGFDTAVPSPARPRYRWPGSHAGGAASPSARRMTSVPASRRAASASRNSSRKRCQHADTVLYLWKILISLRRRQGHLRQQIKLVRRINRPACPHAAAMSPASAQSP